LAQAVQAAQSILTVPFFIRAWGVDGYGRWVTLTAVVSYLFLFELGGQNYVTNVITIEYSRGNFDAVRAKLGEALSFFLTLGLAVFGFLMVGLVVALNVALPLVGRPITESEAWVVVLLRANMLVLSVPAGLYVTIYRAARLYARGTMIGNYFRTFGIVLGIAVLVAGGSIVTYAATTFVSGLLLTIVVIVDSRRAVPQFTVPFVSASFYKASPGLVYLHALRGAVYLIPFGLLVVAVSLLGGTTFWTLVCLGCMGLMTIPMALMTMKSRQVSGASPHGWSGRGPPRMITQAGFECAPSGGTQRME